MRRSWVDSGALSAVPAVHYTAVDGRLRYRSAARLLPSQSLSSFAIPFDSRSPSLKGDILSLQLWGDIILEQEHAATRQKQLIQRRFYPAFTRSGRAARFSY